MDVIQHQVGDELQTVDNKGNTIRQQGVGELENHPSILTMLL